VLVVERDPTYARAATTATHSCIRQQYGSEINVRISQFGADFIHNFSAWMEDDAAPPITLQNFGYLYLADTPEFAEVLRDNAQMQNAMGAGTRILTPDEILADYPFYNLDGIILGSLNTQDEGYFDGGTIFDWFRRKARARGVEYIHNEVTGITRDGARVTGVTLASGETIAAGWIVNASGTRGNATAQMAGLSVPVEPRKRYTWIFDCATPLGRDLPLTIDPSGAHIRTDGRYFMAGGIPSPGDPVPDVDDFTFDEEVWEEQMWPAIATRVPAFERIKVINTWVGHYDYNTLDQNAVIGPHPEVANFLFCNGFSGHGLQQSPAVGRGLAERIIHGRYTTLDLSPLGYERIVTMTPLRERAII
jgi:glycine/D-amino acid oxidase-like deaminating enzyme